MQCEYRDSGPACGSADTELVWCPTWVSSNRGPTAFCPEHSALFHRADGEPDSPFFFGDAARKAFNRVHAYHDRNGTTYDELVRLWGPTNLPSIMMSMKFKLIADRVFSWNGLFLADYGAWETFTANFPMLVSKLPMMSLPLPF